MPRRAGERGALEAGALPTLLPGGRPVSDPAAREQVAEAWGVVGLPDAPGRDTAGILEAATTGQIDALVVGGVDAADLADLRSEEALAKTFVVSLELRRSSVTAVADVVLPVAPHAEKGGTFVDWEGRPRPFEAALGLRRSVRLPRARHAGLPRWAPSWAPARSPRCGPRCAALGPWTGERPSAPVRAGGRGARRR